MDRIIVRLCRHVRRRLERLGAQTKDAEYRTRVRVVLLYDQGLGCVQIGRALGISPQSSSRIARRFLNFGEQGLVDGREHNGTPKVDPDLLEALAEVVGASPQSCGWTRPTWTRELMAKELARKTGVEVSVTTIHRMLVGLGARWGMPRPVVACPWPRTRRMRRIREIRRILDNLPGGEVAYYQDEADLDLNPKIGRDWMLLGTQKLVLTPGRNQKRYLAGALSTDGRRLVLVTGRRKNTDLFLCLLEKLLRTNANARKIHLVLDNYVIHSSRRVQRFLATEGRRIRLHFLPPYSPNHNLIELVWKDLHANVTRNHTCTSIEQLLGSATAYLRKRGRTRAWRSWFARSGQTQAWAA